MGGHNSADVAQLTHECLLQGYGCLTDDIKMEYGAALPHGDVLEGVYQDDHALASAAPLATRSRDEAWRAADSGRLRDRARKAYKRSGLVRKLEKEAHAGPECFVWRDFSKKLGSVVL